MRSFGQSQLHPGRPGGVGRGGGRVCVCGGGGDVCVWGGEPGCQPHRYRRHSSGPLLSGIRYQHGTDLLWGFIYRYALSGRFTFSIHILHIWIQIMSLYLAKHLLCILVQYGVVCYMHAIYITWDSPGEGLIIIIIITAREAKSSRHTSRGAAEARGGLCEVPAATGGAEAKAKPRPRQKPSSRYRA